MLGPDFRDMLSAFIDQKVEFLVVGAHAMAAHGFARSTGDIDLWIARSEENAARTIAALRQFGAPLFDLTEEDLVTPGIVFQIGVEPHRIDILTRISGLEFDEAWPGRHNVNVNSLEFAVIGLDDLIRNKRASGRPKDILDISVLEAGDAEIASDSDDDHSAGDS
ncbi:MAG: nucleotidyltransferase [Planctomycetes bacterium]|nr:nucleotidyltransferase [Planctomycetota bacterium]